MATTAIKKWDLYCSQPITVPKIGISESKGMAILKAFVARLLSREAASNLYPHLEYMHFQIFLITGYNHCFNFLTEKHIVAFEKYMLIVKHQNNVWPLLLLSPQYLIHSGIILVLWYWVKFTYIIYRIFELIFISEIGL